MAKVERFEDLICWQKARELVSLVYSISGNNAEETTKTIKGLIRFLYNKAQKSANKIAEQEVIYNIRNNSLGNDLLLDLPEEFMSVL